MEKGLEEKIMGEFGINPLAAGVVNSVAVSRIARLCRQYAAEQVERIEDEMRSKFAYDGNFGLTPESKDLKETVASILAELRGES